MITEKDESQVSERDEVINTEIKPEAEEAENVEAEMSDAAETAEETVETESIENSEAAEQSEAIENSETAEITEANGEGAETPVKHKAARPRRLRIRGPIYHSIHRFHHLSRHQKKKHLRVGFVLLVLMIILTGFVIYKDYQERPGILERSTLKATERGTDSLTIQWQGTRNTDSYAVFYKPADAPDSAWNKLVIDNEKGSRDSVVLEELEEGTKYSVVVRADNDERTGFGTDPKNFATRKSQKITGKKKYMKLSCSSAFNLDLKAETAMKYKSSDEEVVKVDKNGKVTLKGGGKAKIKVTAEETKDYTGADYEVKIEVIETSPVRAGGASAHIIYSLSPDNCEPVKYIAGSGGAVIPQAFGFTGDKYIVAYGMSGSQRIITFDKDGTGKSVSVPSIALGHPNGFCYADSNKTCYCVKGWSGRAVTYKPETGEYGVVNFPNGASGIGYDRKEDLIYTCSRTLMAAYSIGENGYHLEHSCGVVKHSGHTYTQDCGGHAGIMMRCLSGSSKHGTNYVDLYDMLHGQYLGTIACDLSEVESATVDEDGYMLLLSNTSSSTDVIWKTPVNIEDIGAGLSAE